MKTNRALSAEYCSAVAVSAQNSQYTAPENAYGLCFPKFLGILVVGLLNFYGPEDMKRSIIAIALTMGMGTPAFAQPSDWSEEEWRRFFDAAAAGNVVDAPKAAASAKLSVPMMDVYYALNNMPSRTKPELVTWLGNRRAQANSNRQVVLEERYQDYAIAIVTGDSSRIKDVLSKSYGRTILEGSAMVPVTTVNLSASDFGRVQHAAMDTPSFNGVWKTSWGELHISVDEFGKASGGYSYRADRGSRVRGTLKGTVSGLVLSISKWTETIPGVKTASGDATLTLSEDGRHFEGPWHTTVGRTYLPSGIWKGDRRAAPDKVSSIEHQ